MRVLVLAGRPIESEEVRSAAVWWVAVAFGRVGGLMGGFPVFAYLGGFHPFSGSVWPPGPATAVGLLCVAIAIVLRIGAMPALGKPRPLWHLLVMLGCAIIAPLLLFGVYTGIRITDAQLREVRENLAIEDATLSAGGGPVFVCG